jgi:hypothetical protein
MKEVWMFADWNKLSSNEKQRLIDLKATDVVLGITAGHSKWRRSMTNQQILDDMNWLHINGMSTHIMFWISRNQTYIDDCIEDLKLLISYIQQNSDLQIKSFLYDAEYHWHKGSLPIHNAIPQLSSFHSYIRMVTSNMKRLVQFGVTGLGGKKIHRNVAELLKICDYGLPQAYTPWFPNKVTDGKKHWSHSLSTEPGTIQIDSNEAWGKYNKPLVMGLGCYYLTRPPRFGLPKMTKEENLTKSLKTTVDLGYDKIAYWSLNNCKATSIINFISKINDGNTQDNPIGQKQIGFAPMQWMLVMLGYNLGNYGPNKDGVDGNWGERSQRALNKFRDSQHLSIQGQPTLYDALALIEFYRSHMSNR